MNKFLLRTLVFSFTMMVATMLSAQATRTWVSGVGDDANPCSRTAPCKTFAGAISKTAAKGEISVLDPGGFGAVTITKSIMINGGDQISGISAASTNGIIINAAATDVVYLRNIDINGMGSGFDGIRVLQAKEVYIEDCRIHNFTNNGVKIQNTSGTVKVYIRNSTIHNITLDGVFVFPTAPGVVNLEVDHSSITQCAANGIDVAGANNIAAAFASSLNGNGTAFTVQQTTSSGVIEACDFHYNTTAILAGAGGTPTVRLSHSIITNNGTGIGGGGTTVGCQNNVVAGNTAGNTLGSSTACQQ